MKKAALAVLAVQKRITHADHVLTGLPSERQLALELGMSRTTVRLAVQQLLEQSVLVRRKNGRLAVAAPAHGGRKRTLGFVSPAFASADVEVWRKCVSDVFEGHAVTVRPVSYGHWADPAIQEVLASFDGMFFVPHAEPMPKWLSAKMSDSPCRVVVLDRDESASGLPSVTMFPPAAEEKLFDHLYHLGHRHIDCLNTQGEDDVITGRISAWKHYKESRGLSGQLRSLTMNRPIESAYQLVSEALREGRPVGSAVFCTTGPAAIGAMRALYEAGLDIGRDVSVCAVNSEGMGKYLLRSLTALESPPRSLYLRGASEWMLRDAAWQGPLLVQPDDVPLFVGESTGPAPTSPTVSLIPGWEVTRPQEVNAISKQRT